MFNTKFVVLAVILLILIVGGIISIFNFNADVTYDDFPNRPRPQDDSNDISNKDDSDDLDNEFKDSNAVRLIDPIICTPSHGAATLSGISATCYKLGVTCGGIPERQIDVKQFSQNNSKGSVFFMGPGDGSKSYSRDVEGDEKAITVETLLNNGYEVYEGIWFDGSPRGEALPHQGWLIGAEGAGYKGAMCGYAEVLKWTQNNLVDNPNTMCALGNSGGALQISYGLTYYGLEDVLDMVIFTGGPPVVRLDDDCAAPKDANYDGGAATQVGDYLNGWEDNGDYCKTGTGGQNILDLADKDSLISDLTPGLFKYPNTNTYFLGATGDSAFLEAKEYYQIVNAKNKDWFEFGGKVHWFDSTPEGGSKARELFLSQCN